MDRALTFVLLLMGVIFVSGCAAAPSAPGAPGQNVSAPKISNISGANASAVGAGAGATALALQEKIGFCDGFTYDTTIDINDDIKDSKSMGMGIARPLGNVFAQETIEKTKGSYDFSNADFVVKKMQDAGIKIFGTVFPNSIPKIPQTVDLTSFAAYVKAVVDRYNADGKNDMPGLTTKIIYWEVGIEPFCEASADTTTCYKNFFDLVKAAYQSAKSVDSSLMISPGGAGPIYGQNGQLDTGAVSGIYKYFFNNGGINYTDFFNFHYLVGTKSTDIKQYIDYWKQYTGSKELWLSETGTRDVGDKFKISSNEDEEALWAKQHIEAAFANGITKLFWCRAEHSFSDMPKVVETLQNFAKQFGANPVGSVVTRPKKTQQGTQMPGNMSPPQGGMQQPPGGGTGGYCGDGTCQDIERTTGGCPQDCK